jgi:phenylacetate-CoA ligase
MHPEDLPRSELDRLQAERLSALFAVLPRSAFYRRKLPHELLAAGQAPEQSLWVLRQLPFTTKAELTADHENDPPYGSNLTQPRGNYVRLCQTSGTTGRALRWLDTAADWGAMLDHWHAYFRMAGLRSADVLFFPFSFGPFLGFWTAFEAGIRFGCLTLPGGGMTTTARLRLLLENQATVVFCTPSYALHLAEAAQTEGINLETSAVRALVVAGEPGGSVPGTRQRIETGWGARVIDHHGMTEIGPASIECAASPGGLHILESAFVAEVIDPETGRPLASGVEGELVLTNLTRLGNPLVRYRTGDRVRVDPTPCPCGRALLRLDGGIRGRVDDMLHVRGNNVHPIALQALLHRIPEVAEFRIEIDASAALTELRIAVEPVPSADAAVVARRVDQAIQQDLLFRAVVQMVPPGTLPRAELKARRIVRKIAGPGANEGGK